MLFGRTLVERHLIFFIEFVTENHQKFLSMLKDTAIRVS